MLKQKTDIKTAKITDTQSILNLIFSLDKGFQHANQTIENFVHLQPSGTNDLFSTKPVYFNISNIAEYFLEGGKNAVRIYNSGALSLVGTHLNPFNSKDVKAIKIEQKIDNLIESSLGDDLFSELCKFEDERIEKLFDNHIIKDALSRVGFGKGKDVSTLVLKAIKFIKSLDNDEQRNKIGKKLADFIKFQAEINKFTNQYAKDNGLVLNSKDFFYDVNQNKDYRALIKFNIELQKSLIDSIFEAVNKSEQSEKLADLIHSIEKQLVFYNIENTDSSFQNTIDFLATAIKPFKGLVKDFGADKEFLTHACSNPKIFKSLLNNSLDNSYQNGEPNPASNTEPFRKLIDNSIELACTKTSEINSKKDMASYLISKVGEGLVNHVMDLGLEKYREFALSLVNSEDKRGNLQRFLYDALTSDKHFIQAASKAYFEYLDLPDKNSTEAKNKNEEYINKFLSGMADNPNLSYELLKLASGDTLKELYLILAKQEVFTEQNQVNPKAPEEKNINYIPEVITSSNFEKTIITSLIDVTNSAEFQQNYEKNINTSENNNPNSQNDKANTSSPVGKILFHKGKSIINTAYKLLSKQERTKNESGLSFESRKLIGKLIRNLEPNKLDKIFNDKNFTSFLEETVKNHKMFKFAGIDSNYLQGIIKKSCDTKEKLACLAGCIEQPGVSNILKLLNQEPKFFYPTIFYVTVTFSKNYVAHSINKLGEKFLRNTIKSPYSDNKSSQKEKLLEKKTAKGHNRIKNNMI